MSGAVKVGGVDFATVFVSDYPAAVEFYGGLLGLEHSADYGKIPGGEFETGNLTLQVIDAAAIGREFTPSGHPIAFREQHHVSDDEFAAGNALGLSVANHQRTRAGHVAQRVEGLFAAALLNVGDGDDDEHEPQQHQRFVAITQREIDRPAGHQQQEHRLQRHVP